MPHRQGMLSRNSQLPGTGLFHSSFRELPAAGFPVVSSDLPNPCFTPAAWRRHMKYSHLPKHHSAFSFRVFSSRSLLLLAALSEVAPEIQAQDYGSEGPDYTGAISTPTTSKPESKLWFNDGFWWASLWSSSAGRYRIHRLDLSTQSWVDTGVNIDNRSSTVQDALWDGSKLYLASHEFGNTLSGKQGKLYRFSYQPATKQYQLDSGYPAKINNYRSE